MKEKYNKLVKRIIGLINYDINYLKGTWAEKYYKEVYEKYLKQCNEFLNNNNLKFKLEDDKGCKLLNNINELLDFVFENKKPSLEYGQEFNCRLNTISIQLEKFIFDMFE